jgi:hypothetical protein
VSEKPWGLPHPSVTDSRLFWAFPLPSELKLSGAAATAPDAMAGRPLAIQKQAGRRLQPTANLTISINGAL